MKNMTACGSCHENISNLELASTKKKVSPLIEPFENLQRVILITMVMLDLCPFNFGLLISQSRAIEDRRGFVNFTLFKFLFVFLHIVLFFSTTKEGFTLLWRSNMDELI